MSFPLRILVAWAIDAAALAIAAWIFSGITVGGSAGTLIIAALVYGILATFVKPVLTVDPQLPRTAAVDAGSGTTASAVSATLSATKSP